MFPSARNIASGGAILKLTILVFITSDKITYLHHCIRYRQILQRKNTEDTGNIQNVVYEGDTRADRELPQIPHTDGDYEQPAEYAQLDSSKRVPIHENYQSLIVQG